MTWLCKCGLNNSGLNTEGSCAAAFKDGREHYQITANTVDFHQYVVAVNELDERRIVKWAESIKMTEQEELFATFYNREKIFVKDMDAVQLREHRDLLSKIALEAKAKLVATDDESRERASKTKNKDWLTTSNNPQTESDAINAVKTRAARLSKMDKLRNQLIAAGIDDETVKEMVKNLERKATEKSVKAITFNKPSVEQAVVIVETNKPIEQKSAFDPSSLKFGS